MAAMNILVRAIITGFGFKLGADLYRYIGKKMNLPFVPREEEDGDEEAEDD